MANELVIKKPVVKGIITAQKDKIKKPINKRMITVTYTFKVR